MGTEATVRECRVAVLGGGPAGYCAAIRLGQLGVPVVLVDEGGLGGVCLNEGCIPSKALLHATKTVRHVRDLVEAGVATGDVRVDPVGLNAFKDRTVASLVKGLHELMRANKVKVLAGRGVLDGRGRIRVEAADETDVDLRYESVIVATGSSPLELPILPVDGDRILGSRHALKVAEPPSSLCVVGGGVIGLELATVYAGLGTAVTVVELTDQLMPGTDRDLVQVVAARLKKLGVQVMTDARVTACDRFGNAMRLIVEKKGAPSEVLAEQVLVAAGRRPRTAGIGLDTVGVEPDARGFLFVDDRMRTRVPNVFAAGDVTGAPLLAHKAHIEGEVAAEAAAGHEASLKARFVPAVAFTDPEVATVGLSESRAKAEGIPVLKGRFPFGALGRALAEDAGNGHVKVLVHPQTHVLLGVGIAGVQAGEMIAEAALAVEQGVTAEAIGDIIHSHPTFAEAFQEACRAALGRAIHVVNKV